MISRKRVARHGTHSLPYALCRDHRLLGDEDTFVIAATKSTIYEMNCTLPGVPGPWGLRVRDASGTTLRTEERGADTPITLFQSADFSQQLFFSIYSLASDFTGTYTCTLEEAGQDDTPGHIYRFGCDAMEGISYSLTLRDVATGPTVDSVTEQPNTPTAVSVEVTTPGTYYVLINASSGSHRAPYTCRVEDLGPDDHGDTLALATPIAPSPSVVLTGNRETRQDVDVFSFTALEGHIYTATCGSGSARFCIVRLRDQSGALMDERNSSSWTHEFTSGGTYFLEILSNNIYDMGTYTIRLEDRGTDDHGNTIDTATPVSLGSSVTGWNHDWSDVDTFSFPATAETLYRVTCIPLDPMGDCEMQLHSPSGRANRMKYANPIHFDIDASETETLTLLISRANRGYTVKFEELGRDDHGDTSSNATPLVLGTTVAGNIETMFDVDVFSISLTAGHTYQAEQLHSGLFVTTVRDSNGAELPKGVEGDFTPTTDGTYFVEIRSRYTPSEFPTGSYSVAVKSYTPTRR